MNRVARNQPLSTFMSEKEMARSPTPVTRHDLVMSRWEAGEALHVPSGAAFAMIFKTLKRRAEAALEKGLVYEIRFDYGEPFRRHPMLAWVADVAMQEDAQLVTDWTPDVMPSRPSTLGRFLVE